VNTFKKEDYVSSKIPVMLNKKLQPHPWAVGDMAYRELLEEGNNQAVLICGESGAGKTECCKFVLDFLVAKKESLVENLTEKLLATNDPLEAFGNAKTVNNDNSSRFAKCMQIGLDPQGRVCGAEIQTSLLEKARSCAFFVQERNFHIFYMLSYYRHVKCSPEPGEDQDTDTSDAEDMLGPKAYKYLQTADKYNNIKQGDVISDNEGKLYRERFQAGDIDWFKRVIKSFRVSLGYSVEETHDMMALLTGCLHLGQLEFTDEDACEITPESDNDLAVIADCFGLDAGELRGEMVKERIEMGGTLIAKDLDKRKAMVSRDAIVKSIFSTMFADIVQHCNISIEGEIAKKKGSVGVLDIFGFERMQFNSLEQICINYTNEKLHQTFINEVFETEKKVYSSEGLDPSAIQFTDNAAVLEMTTGCNPHDSSGRTGATAAEIKKKIKVSLFGILDDVCKQEKNDGVTYCNRVVKQWDGATDANGPLFFSPKFGKESFQVNHFAGPVQYGTTEVDKTKFLPPSMWEKEGIDPKCPVIDSFLTKNKDKVPQSLLDFFNGRSEALPDSTGCSNQYYRTIFNPDREVSVHGAAHGGKSTGASAAKTIVSKFNIEIEAFFKQLLTGANPKFIRCINPRPKGIAAPDTMGKRFNLQRVLVQLRYTGILDTVRVRASGYIIRKRYEEFAPTYVHPCNMLGDDHPLQGDLNDGDFAEKVRGDAGLAKEVIRALFGNPDYGVPKEEVLEGTTMIFIKKLTTIAKLNKAKEDLMVEVVKREMAKMNMVALTLRWLATPVSQQFQAQATIRKIWMGYICRKKWMAVWVEFKTFGKIKPLGEKYAMGFLARQSFKITKAQAIEDGRFEAGGQSLIKRKPKKKVDYKSAAESMDFSKMAVGAADTPEARKKAEAVQKAAVAYKAEKEVAKKAGKPVPAPPKVLAESAEWKAADAHEAAVEAAAAAGKPPPPPPKVLTKENVGQALAAGAGAAAEAAPRTQDPAKLKMRTKQFLSQEKLMARLATSLKLLQEHRPTDVHAFLTEVMKGNDPPEVHEKDESGNIYTYIKTFGIFGLLRPALMCCDQDRPKDPLKYVVEFLAGAIEAL
jgi:myosin heavy subunit